MRIPIRWATGALLIPATGLAHVIDQAEAGFAGGVLHAASGLDHCLVALALGAWTALAAVGARRTLGLLTISFMAAWLLPASPMLAAAGVAAVVGALVARSLAKGPYPGGLPILALATGMFGFLHGMGMPLQSDPGFIAGAGGLMLGLFIAGALPVRLLKGAAPSRTTP